MNLIPNKRVIIDCDTGIDDALALMLAVASKDIEVAAVTVVCGNVPTDIGAANTRLVLKLMGREDIPVIAGAAKPLARPLVTAQDTHGMDGLGETKWGRMAAAGEKTDIEEISAAAYIAQSLAKEPGLSVIALGPMTNIAAAMQMDCEAFKNIGCFISMGGSYKSHGNCSPVAEFNYWVDPEAARYVYEHTPVKLHMVGLDVTRKIVLTPDIQSLISRFENERAEFILDITKFYTDFHWKQERVLGCVINDPLAVAYFIEQCAGENERINGENGLYTDKTGLCGQARLCTGFESYVTVETDGLCVGQTIVDDHGFWRKPSNALVLTKTDVYRFMRLFLNTLFPQYEQEIKAGLAQVYGSERPSGNAGLLSEQCTKHFDKEEADCNE